MTAFTAELTGKQEAISVLTARVTAYLVGCGVDAHAVHHMALVLDELLTNVAVHGGAADALVSVRLTVSPDRVTAEVLDGGRMFDPRVEHTPNVSASAEQRPIGGLGLWLVHRVTEDLAYEWASERNRTTFVIRRAPAEKGRGGGNGIG
jgi:anti-sigma regulatory factor (Ser/Thr protein kinase)